MRGLLSVFSTRRMFVVIVLGVLLVGGGAAGAYHWYENSQLAAAAAAYKTPQEENEYVRFDMEIFDIITREYWQKASEKDLAELYKLALAKAAGTAEETLQSSDRAGVAAMIAERLEATPEEKRKNLAVDTGIIVLANLAPQGRSGLLSQTQERSFRDTANNVDRSKDLYASLDVKAGASVAEVEQAYEEKKQALEADTSPEAQQALEDATYAREVLTDESTKVIYDATKIEPTLVSRVIGEHVLYVDLSQITPATLDEFVSTLEKTSAHPELTSLIFDVRGNVGGTLDFAKYLLALFVGPNQYAFDLLRQGELVVERTPGIAQIESLGNFTEMAILTDEMTQSTAELTAAMFKRFNMAKVVGVPTRGWGTVENTYPIATTLEEGEYYSVLLVNHLTLREDNEPIEGHGVDPDVDVSQADWQKKLSGAFRSSALLAAIAELMKQ